MSFLGETLDSVLSQTYKNWECIVIDDGAGDYTRELLEFYCQRFPQITYLRRPAELPRGASSCRNYGYEISKGDFVMWLDDDDVLGIDKLKKQVEVASPDSDRIVTCAWGRLVGTKSDIKDFSIYKDYNDPIHLLVDYAKLEYFPTHVFLVPRKLVKKAGYWDNTLKINDDGVFFAGIIINASEVKFAPGAHVLYRGHTENNLSMLNSELKAKEVMRSWDIIEAMIPENRKNEVAIFLFNIRRFVYRRLKEERYRKIIIKNLFLFRPYIFEDIRRKLKI